MTKEELLVRQNVWKALSNFYLDTELDSADYKLIAKVFRASNYTLTQLYEIDLYEIFPLLQRNLLSPIGVWDGFDSNWLNNKCLALYKKRNRRLFRYTTRFKNQFHYWMRKDHWNEIEILMKSDITL